MLLQLATDNHPPNPHAPASAPPECSGQVVRGAPKDPSKKPGDAVGELFDSARRAGAEEGRPADLHPGAGPSSSTAFTGRSRTLAGGDAPAEAAAGGGGAEEEAPREKAITITFYRNGVFTVDDGGRGGAAGLGLHPCPRRWRAAAL